MILAGRPGLDSYYYYDDDVDMLLQVHDRGHLLLQRPHLQLYF